MSSTPKPPSRGGYFSLLEIMPTVSVLAAIAVIVILALNPKKQFEYARNTRRRGDLSLIADALSSYTRESGRGLIAAVPTAPNAAIEICAGPPAANCLSLEPLLGVYLDSIPRDPSAPSSGHTRYFLLRLSESSITVFAPDTEPASLTDIQVTF